MAKNRRQAHCYIVHEDSGQYEEFRSMPVVAFGVEADAIAERDRRNALADVLRQKWTAHWEADEPDNKDDAYYERRHKKETALLKRRVRLLGSDEFDGVFSIREVPFRGGAV